jgi:protein SCO1/2
LTWHLAKVRISSEFTLTNAHMIGSQVRRRGHTRRRHIFARLVRTAALVLSAFSFEPTLAGAQAPVTPEGSSVNFALMGVDGAAVSEQSYRGKWLAVYFGYTYCPDICPTTMMDIAGALKVLGQRSDKVQGIFVTVDPQRDKPEILSEYLKSFDPRFVGLTGTPAQISAAAKSFHVFYERNDADDGNYTYDHSTFIYLVDPDGKLAKTITDEGGSEGIADDLLALMTAGR